MKLTVHLYRVVDRATHFDNIIAIEITKNCIRTYFRDVTFAVFMVTVLSKF